MDDIWGRYRTVWYIVCHPSSTPPNFPSQQPCRFPFCWRWQRSFVVALVVVVLGVVVHLLFLVVLVVLAVGLQVLVVVVAALAVQVAVAL